DHAMAASEMARVCRPGGRMGLANWTPGGFIGQLFKTLGRHVPPPARRMPPPEMALVARPGGRIALANWTPGGFIGQLFKTLGRHVPPPAGVQPPSLWGNEAHLRALFGYRAGSRSI